MQVASELKENIIKLALIEDLSPLGDITAQSLLNPQLKAKARIIAKQKGVLACSEQTQEILNQCAIVLEEFSQGKLNKLQAQVNFKFLDGEEFEPGDLLAEIQGSAQLILSSERTILNFLQRLSAVATYTHKLTNLIKDYKTRLLDTRKTMPGMRSLEKEAFRVGGGNNHRFNLSDMVLIKENHLIFFKEGKRIEKLNQAIRECRKQIAPNTKIECEISDESELEEVIKAQVDIIMLDNFSPKRCADALALIRELKQKHNINKEIKIEASGGINEKNILDYAKVGVDYISSGSVTTQAQNIDLSMLIEELN